MLLGHARTEQLVRARLRGTVGLQQETCHCYPSSSTEIQLLQPPKRGGWQGRACDSHQVVTEKGTPCGQEGDLSWGWGACLVGLGVRMSCVFVVCLEISLNI